MLNRRSLLTGLGLSLAAAPGMAVALGQAGAEAAARQRREVLQTLARELRARYVFPEIGVRYAEMLVARAASGAYDDLAAEDAFAERVTADLQAINSDGHLRLRTASGSTARRPSSGPGALRGITEKRVLPGGAALIGFDMFGREPEQGAEARAFFLENAAAPAFIIDARAHRGGGLDVMNAMLPLFYDRETTLVRMDTRAGVDFPLEEGPYLRRRESPPEVVRQDHVMIPDPRERGLFAKPLVYLTSSRTASAAEHLALALKRTRRATLVGETTRGAGHYGGMADLGHGFSCFIPVGRTYDPDTNWDWEGRGVSPDVSVAADQAVDAALQRLRA